MGEIYDVDVKLFLTPSTPGNFRRHLLVELITPTEAAAALFCFSGLVVPLIALAATRLMKEFWSYLAEPQPLGAPTAVNEAVLFITNFFAILTDAEADDVVRSLFRRDSSLALNEPRREFMVSCFLLLSFCCNDYVLLTRYYCFEARYFMSGLPATVLELACSPSFLVGDITLFRVAASGAAIFLFITRLTFALFNLFFLTGFDNFC